MYVTYDIYTRQIVRIDTELIDLGEENLKMVEMDITLDDDICTNMTTYKMDDEEQPYIDAELVEEVRKNKLREDREPLLQAFDTFKLNLVIEAISIPKDNKKDVIDWYNAILDLDEDAIKNPPKEVSKYLKNKGAKKNEK